MSHSHIDIRWKQRFNNYNKALAQLSEFIAKGDLNKLEEQGLIKAFEYTYELAWNTMKDFLEYQGENDIAGPRDAIRKSYARGIISPGESWMLMLQDKNRTSHTYNEEIADDIAKAIVNEYYPLFLEFKCYMRTRLDSEK